MLPHRGNARRRRVSKTGSIEFADTAIEFGTGLFTP
jgi:hypothetical protein